MMASICCRLPTEMPRGPRNISATKLARLALPLIAFAANKIIDARSTAAVYLIVNASATSTTKCMPIPPANPLVTSRLLFTTWSTPTSPLSGLPFSVEFFVTITPLAPVILAN